MGRTGLLDGGREGHLHPLTLFALTLLALIQAFLANQLVYALVLALSFLVLLDVSPASFLRQLALFAVACGVVQLILQEFGFAPDDFEHVKDRPGHDLRYAIDSTKLREELGWEPRFTSFEDGLRDTVAWYRDNEPWRRAAKAATEAKYQAAGH